MSTIIAFQIPAGDCQHGWQTFFNANRQVRSRQENGFLVLDVEGHSGKTEIGLARYCRAGLDGGSRRRNQEPIKTCQSIDISTIFILTRSPGTRACQQLRLPGTTCRNYDEGCGRGQSSVLMDERIRASNIRGSGLQPGQRPDRVS